jgi:hypothetical protein
MKKYWHKISQKEINRLIKRNKNYKHVLNNYLPPDWCGFPGALNYPWGCWALCDLEENGTRTKISKKWCATCQYVKKCDGGLP